MDRVGNHYKSSPGAQYVTQTQLSSSKNGSTDVPCAGVSNSFPCAKESVIREHREKILSDEMTQMVQDSLCSISRYSNKMCGHFLLTSDLSSPTQATFPSESLENILPYHTKLCCRS